MDIKTMNQKIAELQEKYYSEGKTPPPNYILQAQVEAEANNPVQESQPNVFTSSGGSPVNS